MLEGLECIGIDAHVIRQRQSDHLVDGPVAAGRTGVRGHRTTFSFYNAEHNAAAFLEDTM